MRPAGSGFSAVVLRREMRSLVPAGREMQAYASGRLPSTWYSGASNFSNFLRRSPRQHCIAAPVSKPVLGKQVVAV